MAEEDGLIVVVLTTSHTVCYANAEESHFMYRGKRYSCAKCSANTKRNPHLGTAQSIWKRRKSPVNFFQTIKQGKLCPN